ncbi:MAG: hypothetical protein ACR2G6_11805, partial [Gemmatimonadaceae bacterium]
RVHPNLSGACLLPTQLVHALALMLLLWDPTPRARSQACDDLTDYAQEAYDYARKAYRTDDFDDALLYAKRAMTAASNAEAAASDCECSDGESYASDAYSYARKAYRAESLEDVQHYAKKAMSAADDTLSAAADCEDS